MLIAVHWCSLSPCIPSPIIYIQWFLMNICLCNFTLIHYFNFDTFFGAGAHQFVMILNKPTPCCCGLWIISVVSVGYLDISLLVCNHLMTFSPALATFMVWRIVQINMAKLTQVCKTERRGEIRSKLVGMWKNTDIFVLCWLKWHLLTYWAFFSQFNVHMIIERMGNLDVTSS